MVDSVLKVCIMRCEEILSLQTHDGLGRKDAASLAMNSKNEGWVDKYDLGFRREFGLGGTSRPLAVPHSRCDLPRLHRVLSFSWSALLQH